MVLWEVMADGKGYGPDCFEDCSGHGGWSGNWTVWELYVFYTGPFKKKDISIKYVCVLLFLDMKTKLSLKETNSHCWNQQLKRGIFPF